MRLGSAVARAVASSVKRFGRAFPWSSSLVSVATLALVTYTHWILARPFVYAAIGGDEQYFLYEGYSLGRGLVPYRDFQEFKPPAIFVANMLALKLFGLQNNRFRYFFVWLALAGFGAIAVALLKRRVHPLVVLGLYGTMATHFFDPKLLWGYAGHSEVATINSAEEVGLSFFLMAVGVFLFRMRWQGVQQLVAGVLLALAPLSKEPFMFPAIAAWLCLMVLHQTEEERPYAWLRFALRTIAGAVFVALAWLAYLLVTRSMSAYLINLRETFVYARDHNVLYGVFPKVGFWDTWAENWKRIKTIYVNPAHLEPFLLLFAAAGFLWPRRALLLGGLVTATFLAGLYAVTIGHGLFLHYFVMAMTGTFFAAALGAANVARLTGSQRRWIAVAVGAAGCYAVWPAYQSIQATLWATPHPPIDDRLVQFIDDHSSRDDRIWSIGNAAVYCFADRKTASRIPFMHDSLLHLYPGATDAERLAPYRAELESHLPKLVIVGAEGADGRPHHMELLVNPFLADHHYKKISPADLDAVYELPSSS